MNTVEPAKLVGVVEMKKLTEMKKLVEMLGVVEVKKLGHLYSLRFVS